VTRTGRLPWPAPDELTAEQSALHRSLVGDRWSAGGSAVTVADADGRLLGPFNAMLLAPAVGGAVSELGAALRHRSSLTGRERELVVLAVAVAERSGFEWHGHRRPALAEGLTADEVAVLFTGAAPETLSARERCLHRTALMLLDRRDLPDPDHAAAVAELGEVAVVELVWLVGYYAVIALSLRVFRVPLPDGAPDPFHDRPATPADPIRRNE
jgi:AhpD family alkylhydroperoxidase